MSDPDEVAESCWDVLIAELLEELRTCTPLVVSTADNLAVSTCEAVPVVPDLLPNGEPDDVPKLVDMPVYYPSGKGTFIHWPLAAGDVALGVCSDRSLAAWQSTREAGDPSVPTLPHFHQISDTQVLPVSDRPTNLDGVEGLDSDIVIGTAAGVAVRVAGGDGTVTVSTPTVSLVVKPDGTIEAGGALKLALNDALVAAIDAMLAGGTPAPNDGGAALKTSMIAAWELVKNSFGTTVLKGA